MPTHSNWAHTPKIPTAAALGLDCSVRMGTRGPRVGARPPGVPGLDEGQVRACLELGSVTELGLSQVGLGQQVKDRRDPVTRARAEAQITGLWTYRDLVLPREVGGLAE